VRLSAPLVTVVALAATPACAHDVVLPDTTQEAVCGDGIVEEGEACDNQSPGCYACEIVPGWTCPNNVCSAICGDGVVGTGADCANPHRDSLCDMTGFWAVRETDYERDMVLQSVQTSSNWYLYQLAQTGDTFTMVASMECGVHVTGSATVDYTPASLQAMLHANPQDGSGPHGYRHGTSEVAAGGCGVSLDRWYFIRALLPSFLPADFSADAPLSSLPPLPSVSDPVNGPDDPPGATDPDGDGFPGIAFQITGALVTGVRDEVQRIWKQYADMPGAPSPAAALTFAVPGALDVQDDVLHVSQCGTGCGLLKTGATVASDIQPRITFSFIGRSLGGARTSTVVVNRPGASVDDDLTTCANVRLMLPHDPSLPPGYSASSSNGL
jgi:hypothetical protein